MHVCTIKCTFVPSNARLHHQMQECTFAPSNARLHHQMYARKEKKMHVGTIKSDNFLETVLRYQPGHMCTVRIRKSQA